MMEKCGSRMFHASEAEKISILSVKLMISSEILLIKVDVLTFLLLFQILTITISIT